MNENFIKSGFVVRTQADQASVDALRCDVLYLQQRAKSLSEQMQNATGVCCVHRELTLSQRTLRDHQTSTEAQVVFAEKSCADNASRFVEQTLPHAKINIEYHSEPSLLFDQYDVEQQINMALEDQVSLPGGGSLIIQQTAAMVTIDINTKAYLGRIDETGAGSDLSNSGSKNTGCINSDSIEFNTNIEACSVIAQQTRLRNLSGIIVIDFIDMQSQQHKNQLINVLKDAFSQDPAKIVVGEVSMLGLVEISRQRKRQSMAMLLTEQCMVCSGQGRVKNTQTICFEIFREIQRQALQFEANAYTIVASDEVIGLLQDQYRDSLENLQEKIDCAIQLKSDSSFNKQQYDIALNSI